MIRHVALFCVALALMAGVMPRAYAQTYDPRAGTSVVLAGGGTSLANTLSLVAPSLTSSPIITLPGATLTFPATNAAGLLINGGSGGLTWNTVLPSGLTLPSPTFTGTVSFTPNSIAYASLPSEAMVTLLGNPTSGTANTTTIPLGTGLGFTSGTTLTNTGVTSAVAGTGIGVSGTTGAVTITNNGVTSIAGTTNQVTASASTGAVTLSLPTTVNIGSTSVAGKHGFTDGTSDGFLGTITPTTLTANQTYTLPNATGTLALIPSGLNTGGVMWANSATTTASSAVGTANQVLISNAASAPSWSTLTAGSGISITPTSGIITIANTGVTSIANGGGITASATTGAITLGSTATNANTASAIVARDASGNFSAGTITAALSGNATTATTATNIITTNQTSGTYYPAMVGSSSSSTSSGTGADVTAGMSFNAATDALTLGVPGPTSGLTGSLILANAGSSSLTTITVPSGAPAITYTLPSVAPTSGQFLSSTTSGGLSWATPSGSGNGSGAVLAGETNNNLHAGYYYGLSTTTANGNATAQFGQGNITTVSASGQLKNFVVTVGSAPGAGNSWTMTLMDLTSGQSGPTVTISGSTTSGSDVSTVLNVNAGDSLTILASSSGGPASSNGADWAVGAYGLGAAGVTSVAMTVPSFLSISGSPITASGTLAVSLSGTALPTANGGTGVASPTAHAVMVAEGSSNMTPVTSATAGTVLTGTSGDPAFSPTPTLGVAGASGTTGTLTFATSGSGNTGTSTIEDGAQAGVYAVYTLPTLSTAPAANQVLSILGTPSGSGTSASPYGVALTWASPVGAVSSVSNSDGTLTISPTTGAVVASLNLNNNDTWTGAHINAPTASNATGLIVKQTTNATHTADIFDVQSSGGSNYLQVLNGGGVTVTSGLLTAGNGLTVSNGGTVTLPATSIANAALQGSGAMTFTSTAGSLTPAGTVALGGSPNYDINIAHPNAWTAQQTHTNSGSSTASLVASNTFNSGASDIALTASTTNAAGAAVNVTSGNVRIAGLSTSAPVFTDASRNLTSTGTVGPANGGTGVASPTAHAVMVAEGSSNMTPVSSTTAGTVLTGTSGDPTFSATPTLGVAGASGTTGTLTFATSGSGNTGTSTIEDGAQAGVYAVYTLPTLSTAPAANQLLTVNTATGSGTSASPYAIGLQFASPGSVSILNQSSQQTSSNFNISGNGTIAGTITTGGTVFTSGTASLTSNPTDDLGLSSTGTYFKLSASGADTLAGITNGVDGRVLILLNTGGNNIILVSEDVNDGTAANRIHLVGGSGQTLILATDGMLILIYDSSINRWRILSSK